MADDLVKEFGSWLLIVVFLGSLVDLCQAAWIVKRQMRRWKRGMLERAKKEVLLEQLRKK